MRSVMHKAALLLTNKEKKSLLMLSVGSFFLSLSETLSIGIIIPIMGLFMDPGRIHTSKALAFLCHLVGCKDSVSFLMMLVFIAVVLFAIKSLYYVWMTYLQQDAIGKIYVRLTGHVLRSYLEKPYAFHLGQNSSVLFKNISAEVGVFTSYLLTPVVIIGSELIILAGIFLFLICMYPTITLLLIAFFMVMTLGTHVIFKNRIKAYSIQRVKESEVMHRVALESLQAVKEITVFGAASIFVERFIRAVKKYTDAFVKFSTISVLPRAIFEFVLIAGILLAIVVSVLLGKTPAAIIPMMTAMGVASLRLLPSASKIYSNINAFHFSGASLDIIYDVVCARQDVSADATDKSHGAHLSPATGSVTVKDITFTYDSSASPIFKGLSLVIPSNRVVAIVGRTGAGKSTLIDIMMGLLTPSQGAVYCQGVRIDRKNIAGHLKRIGYVPQSILLLDDTIASNIAFGVPCDKIDYRRLQEIIKSARLESFVNDLPDGLNSKVGERGVRISGGQRQRIGIARALYLDPDVLVLDEATSALDAHTEAEVYAGLKNAMRDRTILLVTHRLSSLKKADLIYVMDSGLIVDKGSYQELFERCAVFQQIARETLASTHEKGA